MNILEKGSVCRAFFFIMDFQARATFVCGRCNVPASLSQVTWKDSVLSIGIHCMECDTKGHLQFNRHGYVDAKVLEREIVSRGL